MLIWPVPFDSAPCLRALVASSWSTIAIITAFARIQPQIARTIYSDALSMLLLERLQRPIDDSAERGSLPGFRGQHVVRPIQRVQAADEGIAFLGMLI